ncbi:MAG TPA: cupin domain-containing protein [Candidatus Angelobacter sp.]|jgi:quercetin dioxygenase-like cupin family protein|nr:cupin domain-containing protein [Candidatus Angelobacter sp.]
MAFNNMQLMKTAREERADFRDLGVNGRIVVVRTELKQGTFTERHRHESECVVMVLEGALRFHLSNRVVTLAANEMLRLAPGDEHLSEALCDSVVLNISNVHQDRDACGPFRHYDPDQYLWGV